MIKVRLIIDEDGGDRTLELPAIPRIGDSICFTFDGDRTEDDEDFKVWSVDFDIHNNELREVLVYLSKG